MFLYDSIPNAQISDSPYAIFYDLLALLQLRNKSSAIFVPCELLVDLGDLSVALLYPEDQVVEDLPVVREEAVAPDELRVHTADVDKQPRELLQ